MSARRAYLEDLERSLSQGRSLEAACYRDAERFEVECETVLRPAWHAVLRHDDLPEPGDYAAVDLFGEALVVVRDEARALRVFSNVCRHRAHTVVSGRGNGRHLVCPYHRWSYGLDGSLRGAPLMKDEPGFDLAACRLPELRTETWQGFLMVSLEPEPAPFAPPLAALDERLSGLRLDEMVTVGIQEFDSPWNWKVLVENFMESYHHLGAHAETLQPLFPAAGTYCADLAGPFSLLENPTTSEELHPFLVAQVFPSFLFFVNEGPPSGAWFEMQIDRHDHFHLRLHSLAAPELAESEEARAGMLATLRAIHLEDIPMCDAIQRGIQSRLWEPGPLNRREACLPRFHRHLAERLAGAD